MTFYTAKARSLLGRTRRYLRRNLGVPFITTFVLLTIASIILQGYGNSIAASRVAFFAFASFLIGMVLQMVCYIKYGRRIVGSAMPRMVSRIRPTIMRYVGENWGAPFVITFIALLISSAVLLSLGNSGGANSVAVYSFYALVVGVVLQIVSYVKYGEDGSKESLGKV